MALSEDEKEICRDILEKLKETKQIYIVGHDVPISISKTLFELLDEVRKGVARSLGVPEVQYEWEDLFGRLVGLG